MQKWEQQVGESSKAYARFFEYLQMGADRSLAKLCRHIGKEDHYLTQLKTWSSKYGWVERAKAFDTAEFSDALEGRQEVRERARQIHVEAASEMAKVILEIARDKEANPFARLQAAIRSMELAGITVPKRVEVSGPDGSEVQLAARQEVAGLTDAQLEALGAALEAAGGD